MNKIFNKVPVHIQNRSGFDLSHPSTYTMKVGTLYPILCDQLIPGDRISLGHLTEVQLPPMATDFYGRVQLKLEAFFCPNRLCYGGFQQFITQPTDNQSRPNGYPVANVKYLPSASATHDFVGRGSLADFLGYKLGFEPLPGSQRPAHTFKYILPFVAYHKIWQDWYRDSLLQQECFANLTVDSAGALPFKTYTGNSPFVVSNELADNTSLFSLRQRCFPRDYFTNAKLNPQAGTPATLAFNVADNQGSFTISSLRAVNSLQLWMERNNLAGNRYIDQIKGHYGVTPSDAIMDRPVYLGSHSFDIYNKGVYQSAGSDQSTNNPLGGIGAKFGSSMGVSDSSLVDSFQATEFGFIMVMASIVPEAIYGSGIRRYLDYNVVSDFANPILSAVGDQAIKAKELSLSALDEDTEFGYTQRYSEYKFMLGEVHGEIQDGGTLQSFALQRTFDGTPELSSSFIEIPTNYMDQVTAVTAEMSRVGAWAHTYFNYKKSSVLPAYSIPTLGDPKDTHTEVINNGGTRL